MAKLKRKPRRTDDRHIEGVKRIDAPPKDIARALFGRDHPKAHKSR